MASSRRIWVYHNKVWSKGSVVAGTSPQHVKKVLIDGHAKPVSLSKKPTMAVKHNDRRKTKERAEVLPTKAVGPRPERFRPPEIVIEAVAFTRQLLRYPSLENPEQAALSEEFERKRKRLNEGGQSVSTDGPANTGAAFVSLLARLSRPLPAAASARDGDPAAATGGAL